MPLNRFKADRRGAAAVEFALIAPFMILLYFGLVELTLGMMAERRAAHAASVVADLVAQSSQVSVAEVGDIFKVAGAILQPFPAAPLKMRVTSVTADANAVPKVDWSQVSGGMTALGAQSTATQVPANFLAASDSVIMAEVSYTYTSPLHQVVPKALGFSETFFLRPRRSPKVTLVP